MELNNKLYNKIKKDMKEIENEFMCFLKKDIFNQSYRIATLQQFGDEIMRMCEDFEDFVFEKKYMHAMIDYNGNLIKLFADKYICFNHPEYYDFWYNTDDLLKIAELIIKQEIEDKK